MKRMIAIEIIATLLTLLFVYAATSKLIEYEEFKLELAKSPFINPFSDQIAWLIPISEIVIALLLMTYKTRIIGLFGSLFLMTMFSSYIYAMLHYSYYIPCSCGGILSKMGWNAHFWFNIVFTFLSISGILIHSNGKKNPARSAVENFHEAGLSSIDKSGKGSEANLSFPIH